METAHEAAQIFLNYCTCAQVKVEWMCLRAHYGCVFFRVFVSHLFRYCWCLGLKVPDILDGWGLLTPRMYLIAKWLRGRPVE